VEMKWIGNAYGKPQLRQEPSGFNQLG